MSQTGKVWAYRTAGIASFAVGIVGIIVPLLPTTPFVLLAAWCFSRSSPRFHKLMYESERFGPIIKNWEQNGAIPRKAKILATVMITISLSTSIFWMIDFVPAKFMVGLMGIGLVTWIWRYPDS